MWRNRKVIYYKYDADTSKENDEVKHHRKDWSSIRISGIQRSGINTAPLAWYQCCKARGKKFKKIQEKLQKQLESVLCLIIDERSMLSSNMLAAAERNVRQATTKPITQHQGDNNNNQQFV